MPIPACGEYIVVQRQIIGWAAVGSQHGMSAFFVEAMVQGFTQYAPLQGEISASFKVMGTVDGPAQ